MSALSSGLQADSGWVLSLWRVPGQCSGHRSDNSFVVFLWGVRCETGSSPVLPFFDGLFRVVNRVSSGEEIRGGVPGCTIGASGERGRRCPRSSVTW